jgi:hypothetical protein
MFFEAHNLSLLMGRAQVMLFLFLGIETTETGRAASYFFAARFKPFRANNKFFNQTNTEYKNG